MLWLLAAGLASCGGKVGIEVPPEVALKHQYEAAFQRQAQLLQARRLKLSVMAGGANATQQKVLVLDVDGLPSQLPPDTLRQQVHKLAHLLAVDLTRPQDYNALNVRVSENTGFFKPDVHNQSFIYSLSNLR